MPRTGFEHTTLVMMGTDCTGSCKISTINRIVHDSQGKELHLDERPQDYNFYGWHTKSLNFVSSSNVEVTFHNNDFV